jgi:hypothetical protein
MHVTQTACLGALALELRPGTHAARPTLSPQQAAELAEGVAHDLATLIPEAASLDLVLLAAHYDPVELLRPGWPLHEALDALAQRVPPDSSNQAADRGRVLAFGAYEGRLPGSLRAPEPDYARGAMRLVPFLLRGSVDTHAKMKQVSLALEEILIDRGMAGAATALFSQHAFGALVEHARYVTIHDLAALMAMQYENVGIAPLWPLIEAALLLPQTEAWLDAPPEPLARYTEGGVRMALLDAQAWRSGGFAPSFAGEDADKLELAFEHFEARQRQIAAVLEAHSIPVTFDYCPVARDPRTALLD